MKLNKNQQAFFALVEGGLWEKKVRLQSYGEIDFKEIYRLAQEQAVVGLVAAGLEHVEDINPPKEDVLLFISEALQLERRNSKMNVFISNLIEKLRSCNIDALLIKGQGIAQCYEKPLWRAAGDIDLFLSETNYNAAKALLMPLASKVEREIAYYRHFAITIHSWEIELHGSIRNGLWKCFDKMLNGVQDDIFCGGAARSWMNGKTQVFIPNANEDVILLFSHILQHYYKEGVGLRQICDWCRLLWSFFDCINLKSLESRIDMAGIRSEWKTFSAVAVDYLGMPKDRMPFYSTNNKWRRKAEIVINHILTTGSFGHNRDYSYYQKQSYIKQKATSFLRHTKDSFNRFLVFPYNSVIVWSHMLFEGVMVVLKRNDNR